MLSNSHPLCDRLRPYLTWNALWLLLFFTGMGWFFIVMPKAHDDLWFLEGMSSWFQKQGYENPTDGGNIFIAGFPWDNVKYTLKYHYLYDNGRLTNVCGTVLLLFPKWFCSGLMLLCWIGIVMLAFSISGIDWKKSPLVAPAIFLFTFLLPWHDSFGYLIFQINYILPSFLCLLAFKVLQKQISSQWRLNAWFFLPIGMLLGLFHEGFSASMLLALGCMFLFIKRYRRLDVFLMCLGLLASTVWLLFLVPGKHTKFIALAQHSLKFYATQANFRFISIFVKKFLPFTLCMLFFLVVEARRRWRSKGPKMTDSLFETVVFLMLNALGSILIFLSVLPEDRALFWLNLCGIIGLMALAREYVARWLASQRVGVLIADALLLACVFVHWAFVDHYTLLARRDIDKLLSDSLNSPGFFASDMPLEHELPFPCLGIPMYNYHTKALLYYGSYRKDSYEKTPYPQLIPARLLDFDESENPDARNGEGIAFYKGCYIIPRQQGDKYQLPFIYWYHSIYPAIARKDGKTEEVQFWLQVFRSAADGKEYYWMIPTDSKQRKFLENGASLSHDKDFLKRNPDLLKYVTNR